MHGEDPTGRAGDISKEWRVVARPLFAKQQDNGRLVSMSPLAVRPGDFVEVIVTPDVVSIEKGGGQAEFCQGEHGHACGSSPVYRSGVGGEWPFLQDLTYLQVYCSKCKSQWLSLNYMATSCKRRSPVFN